METIVEQIASQVIGWGVGTFLAAIVAACGVGGFIWRKINANQLQDQRMDELMRLIKSNEEMLRVMSCHQLEIACERALAKGCTIFRNCRNCMMNTWRTGSMARVRRHL